MSIAIGLAFPQDVQLGPVQSVLTLGTVYCKYSQSSAGTRSPIERQSDETYIVSVRLRQYW